MGHRDSGTQGSPATLSSFILGNQGHLRKSQEQEGGSHSRQHYSEAGNCRGVLRPGQRPSWLPAEAELSYKQQLLSYVEMDTLDLHLKDASQAPSHQVYSVSTFLSYSIKCQRHDFSRLRKTKAQMTVSVTDHSLAPRRVGCYPVTNMWHVGSWERVCPAPACLDSVTERILRITTDHTRGKKVDSAPESLDEEWLLPGHHALVIGFSLNHCVPVQGWVIMSTGQPRVPEHTQTLESGTARALGCESLKEVRGPRFCSPTCKTATIPPAHTAGV